MTCFGHNIPGALDLYLLSSEKLKCCRVLLYLMFMLLFLSETCNSFTTSPKTFVAVPAKLVFIFGSFLSVLNVISKQNHLKYFLCECLNSNAIFGEHKVQCLNSRWPQWEACFRSWSLIERKCSLRTWLCLSNTYNSIQFISIQW